MKSNVLKTLKPFVAKHEPELLMVMGISGMIFSVVWGIKATGRAVRILDEKKQDLGTSKLSVKQVVGSTWKLYLPVVVSTAASIPCIVAGNRVSNKRNMALAAAYTMTETALQEYQEKTKEIIGDKKYEKLQEQVSAERVKKTYDEGMKNVIMVGDGDSLFYEPLSGRYFKTNWNRIAKAANELNADALGSMDGEITLGDWYDILELPRLDMDDTRGWTIADGKHGLIDISIDSVISPEDQPCGAIRYNTEPKIL